MERKTSDVDRTADEMTFEGTTFARTEIVINWESEFALINGATADFNDTVRAAIKATENDEWEETYGSLAPVADLI